MIEHHHLCYASATNIIVVSLFLGSIVLSCLAFFKTRKFEKRCKEKHREVDNLMTKMRATTEKKEEER